MILGIALAFLLQDDKDAQQYATQNTDHPLLKNDQDDGFKPSDTRGWDEQEDYIHREKKDEEIPEKSEMAVTEDKEEKKRSGEYELPPPPEV